MVLAVAGQCVRKAFANQLAEALYFDTLALTY